MFLQIKRKGTKYINPQIYGIKWCTRAPYSTFGFVVLVENKKEDEADSRLSLSIAIHFSNSLFLSSFLGCLSSTNPPPQQLIAYSLPPPLFFAGWIDLAGTLRGSDRREFLSYLFKIIIIVVKKKKEKGRKERESIVYVYTLLKQQQSISMRYAGLYYTAHIARL